jgi:hypothetical protein
MHWVHSKVILLTLTFIPPFVPAVRFADRSSRRKVGDTPSPSYLPTS